MPIHQNDDPYQGPMGIFEGMDYNSEKKNKVQFYQDEESGEIYAVDHEQQICSGPIPIAGVSNNVEWDYSDMANLSNNYQWFLEYPSHEIFPTPETILKEEKESLIEIGEKLYEFVTEHSAGAFEGNATDYQIFNLSCDLLEKIQEKYPEDFK